MDVGEEAGEGGPEPEWNAIEASEDPVALHGLLLLRTRSLYIRFVCLCAQCLNDDPSPSYVAECALFTRSSTPPRLIGGARWQWMSATQGGGQPTQEAHTAPKTPPRPVRTQWHCCDYSCDEQGPLYFGLCVECLESAVQEGLTSYAAEAAQYYTAHSTPPRGATTRDEPLLLRDQWLLRDQLHSPHSSDASAALPLLLQTMRRSTHAGGRALPVGELVLVVRDCLIIIRSRGKAALASLECGECS